MFCAAAMVWCSPKSSLVPFLADAFTPAWLQNMLTDQGLADIAKYAQILGAAKGYYAPTNASTGAQQPPNAISQ